MSAASEDGRLYRLVRDLAAGAFVGRGDDGGWRVGGEAGRPLADDLVATLLARGFARIRDGHLEPGPAARAFLRRAAAPADEAYAAQHQERTAVRLGPEDGGATVTVDTTESPLAWLRSRKGRDGRPLIDAAEFEAGERLRSDFTRGQMTPRLTVDWTATGGGGAHARGPGELTEAALSARIRVERALDAVGTDFAGVLLDVCCFLSGVEAVERARGWPARSAKLVLQLALRALARHYGLAAAARGPARAGAFRHWGAEDYRPRAG